MDTNVPPFQTLLVADALIKANKDFELLLLPNQNHGYGTASNYMMRRRSDFLLASPVFHSVALFFHTQPLRRAAAIRSAARRRGLRPALAAGGGNSQR